MAYADTRLTDVRLNRATGDRRLEEAQRLEAKRRGSIGPVEALSRALAARFKAIFRRREAGPPRLPVAH